MSVSYWCKYGYSLSGTIVLIRKLLCKHGWKNIFGLQVKVVFAVQNFKAGKEASKVQIALELVRICHQFINNLSVIRVYDFDRLWWILALKTFLQTFNDSSNDSETITGSIQISFLWLKNLSSLKSWFLNFKNL